MSVLVTNILSARTFLLNKPDAAYDLYGLVFFYGAFHCLEGWHMDLITTGYLFDMALVRFYSR